MRSAGHPEGRRKSRSVMLVTVGRIISARTSEPANQLNPRVKPSQCEVGPQERHEDRDPEPAVDDARDPDEHLHRGLGDRLAHRGAISDMKRARPTDSGVAMTAATSITADRARDEGQDAVPVSSTASGVQVARRSGQERDPRRGRAGSPFQTMNPSSRTTRTNDERRRRSTSAARDVEALTERLAAGRG